MTIQVSAGSLLEAGSLLFGAFAVRGLQPALDQHGCAMVVEFE